MEEASQVRRKTAECSSVRLRCRKLPRYQYEFAQINRSSTVCQALFLIIPYNTLRKLVSPVTEKETET